MHALDGMYPDFEYQLRKFPNGTPFLRLPAPQGREAILAPHRRRWMLMEGFSPPIEPPNEYVLAGLREDPMLVARKLVEELKKPAYTRY